MFVVCPIEFEKSAADSGRQAGAIDAVFSLGCAVVKGVDERLGGQELGQKDWDGNEAFGMQIKEMAYGWLDIQALAAPTERTPSDF